MSIFGNILNKIFHHGTEKKADPAANASAPKSASTPAPTRPQVAPASPEPAPSAAVTAAQPSVDVGAVLDAMASMKADHGGNYRTSIVDLLKLLDLDSSLAARKELGEELDVHAGADGTAEQNIALQRAVMDKLASNGGIVPDSLRG
ncbi:DUF3597 domain-containing protein (plasmid) [Novosphingobium resinovorum]|uniref:DUF3597 domain-containing protein n=1 Tax=Novosphingobium TaxID=165696 RepID=UPI001B3C718C|nr:MULTISPECIES: DUF3597 domain-containing protein [Novosphingobium]MBF7015498.1 DUF3597 domain-containing protein [Novosphingobium sp. HR1a]WJM30172.1 DUF3597 domain-containing protein [Novosphingobium resinovorum]